jgi:hypothetical protein
LEKKNELTRRKGAEDIQLNEASAAKHRAEQIVKELGVICKKARDELGILNEKEHAMEDKVKLALP